MVVNFVCRNSKIRNNGLCPIELSIIINGKRRYLSLDRRIKPKSFDSKKQRVKGDKETTDFLEAVRSKCYQIETEMIKAKMLITVDTFIEAYKHGVDSKNISLYGLFDEYIKRQCDKQEHGLITKMSLGKYKCTVRYCKEAIPDKPLIEFTTADTEQIYLSMLKSMTNNAAICYMRKLKTIVFFAIEAGYIDRNPITYHFHKDKIETVPLTLDEVRVIRSKDYGSDRINKVRDIFILQCYTGLSYTDMRTLTKEDIKTDNSGNKWIVKDRQKTGVTSFIPLIETSLEILERYNYKLPVLSNQKYNSYLKEIQEVCRIEKTLHSHLARHTCGTILLNAGVDIMSVSKILGHSSSKITESVYAKMLPETIINRVLEISDKII